MTSPLQNFAMRIAAIAAFGTTLVACGGGGGGGSTSTAGVTSTSTSVPTVPAANAAATPAASEPVAAAPVEAPVDAPIAAPIVAMPDAASPIAVALPANIKNPTATVSTPTTVTTAPVATPPVTSTIFGMVTDVRIQNTSATVQAALPVTFGQVFAAGDLHPSDSLVGRFDNGTMIPLQLDVKATHADGSVRHAVVSGIVQNMGANETRTLALMKSNAPHAGGMDPKTLLKNGFSSSVHATINGVRYNASADDILKAGGAYQTWLSGAVANEWHVSAPLTTAEGVAHPHLTARFAIRWY